MRIWLTDFVDFSIRTGPARVAKVRDIRNRPAYEPALDFWKPLREGIARLAMATRSPRDLLAELVGDQATASKRNLYPRAVDGFLDVLGKQPIELIKLYFKSDQLTKPRVQATIGVMQAELGPKVPSGTRFAVLDVQSGKLQLPDARWKHADTQIVIKGEASRSSASGTRSDRPEELLTQAHGHEPLLGGRSDEEVRACPAGRTAYLVMPSSAT
jgi:hypothetical protein